MGGGGGRGRLMAHASVKGGPYSEGTFPGGGQFGLVDIDDLGDHIVVTMRGMRWDGAALVTLERSFEVD